MKNLIVICSMVLMLSSTVHISAQKQKITWKDDTIKVDGTPYALMMRKGNQLLCYDFSLRGLSSGTELMFFKAVVLSPAYGSTPAKIGYEANVISTGSRTSITQIAGIGMAKLTVENNLVKDDLIDTEAEKRFVQLYHGYYPKTSNNNNSSAVIVNNNINVNTGNEVSPSANTTTTQKSKSPVSLSGNQIIRDSVSIGKFRQDTTSSNYSQKLYLLTIYSVDGEKVAEASVPVSKPEEWKITILADKKEYNIMYDAPGEKEKLFKWLADKGYLVP